MLVDFRCVASVRSKVKFRHRLQLLVQLLSKATASPGSGWESSPSSDERFSLCFEWISSSDRFSFDTPALQTLYQLLCQNGEVTSQDLSEQTEEVQRAWYLMLEENLPDEIAENELEEVEETRNRELLRKESQQIGKKVREASHSGDADQAYWNSSA